MISIIIVGIINIIISIINIIIIIIISIINVIIIINIISIISISIMRFIINSFVCMFIYSRFIVHHCDKCLELPVETPIFYFV